MQQESLLNTDVQPRASQAQPSQQASFVKRMDTTDQHELQLGPCLHAGINKIQAATRNERVQPLLTVIEMVNTLASSVLEFVGAMVAGLMCP